MYPRIKKATRIDGANILLRNASVEDSEFILSLRLDPQKSRYLSPTSTNLADQTNWLRRYENGDDEAYFIVCDKNMHRLGCVRIYDPFEWSYRWGSWLMIRGFSPVISLESALLVYAYGKYLRFKYARVDVRKDNTHVWNFHEKVFSAEKVGETELDFSYVVSEDKINASLQKFGRLITSPLQVSQPADRSRPE